MQKMLCLYGVSRDVEAVQGRPDDEIAQALIDWGIGGAFVEELDLAEALRRRGLKSYAVVRVFEGKDEWEQEPKVRAIGDDGEPASDPKYQASLCPANEGLRERRIEEIRRLAQEPNVDGIWLDFIRFACMWDCPRPVLRQSCFCPTCLGRFATRYDITYPGHLHGPTQVARWITAKRRREWTEWKCQQVTTFLAEAKQVVKTIRPALRLGAFVVPWRDSDFGSAMERIVGQDLSAMGSHLDVVSPMAYHRMCGHDIDWIADVTDRAARRTGRAIWPAVQASDDAAVLTDEQFEAAVRRAMQARSEAVIVFNFEDAARSGRLDVLGGLR